MLPQLITSLNISSIKNLHTLLDLYSLFIQYRAYYLYTKTPKSFKEQIPKSCIYDREVSKEKARKELENVESVVTVSTNEILSVLFKDYCLTCIQTKKYELVNSSSLTSNDTKHDHFKHKSFVNSLNKNVYKCKVCKKNINEHVIIVLSDNTLSLFYDYLMDEYISNIKDANKKIQAILQNTTKDRSLVIIADKKPEVLESNL